MPRARIKSTMRLSPHVAQNNPVYETAKETISLMDSLGEGEGGEIWENGIETCIISCMKRVASPGSRHDTGCLGRCTGTTQREGMGREEGGGFRMGNTGIPVADSF